MAIGLAEWVATIEKSAQFLLDRIGVPKPPVSLLSVPRYDSSKMASSSLDLQLSAAIVLPSGGNIFPFGTKMSWLAEQRL